MDKCPKHLSGGKSKHAIITEDGSYTFPLKLKGVMSYFYLCTPTLEEIASCHHIELTSSSIEWEPYSDAFAKEETKFMQTTDGQNTYQHQINSFSREYDDFPDMILRNLTCHISATFSTKQLFIKAENLAKKWMVSLNMAQETIKATTQSYVRNSIHPIKRRFKTKAAMLWYNHLK